MCNSILFISFCTLNQDSTLNRGSLNRDFTVVPFKELCLLRIFTPCFFVKRSKSKAKLKSRVKSPLKEIRLYKKGCVAKFKF